MSTGTPCRLVAHTRSCPSLKLIRWTPARMNSEPLGSLRPLKQDESDRGLLTARSKRLTTMHAVADRHYSLRGVVFKACM